VTSSGHFLRILSSLENADKHRGLIVLSRGVDNLVADIAVKGVTNRVSFGKMLYEDGAEFIGFAVPPRTSEAEVHVKIRGTATVALEVSGVTGYFEMPDTFRGLLAQVERYVFPKLEPFVRRTHDGTTQARSIRADGCSASAVAF
jgi:hypothetical protein